MKTILIIAMHLALVAPVAAQTGEFHTWTSADGRVIQAKFLKIDGQSVLIEKDGLQFVVFIGKLSAESAALARRLDAQNGASLRQSEAGIGPKVLAFCRSKMGSSVGNGQCATLAVQALEHAAAEGMGKDAPGAGDYVWGRQVASIESTPAGVRGFQDLPQITPGDVVQFRNVRFEGARHDGGGGVYWMMAFHHTAIVADVDPEHAIVRVYQQNWGPKKRSLARYNVSG